MRRNLETERETTFFEYVHEAFNSVNCYLMPKPGDLVEEADSDITLKGIVFKNYKRFLNEVFRIFLFLDIKPEFIQHIQLLTECLLNPENLIAKRIGKDVATGSWLVEYIAEICDKLKKKEPLKPEAMMEV